MWRKNLTISSATPQQGAQSCPGSAAPSVVESVSALPLTYEQMVSWEESVEERIAELEMEVYRLGYSLDTGSTQLGAMRQQLQEDHARGLRSIDEFRQLEDRLDGFATDISQLETERDDLSHSLELADSRPPLVAAPPVATRIPWHSINHSRGGAPGARGLAVGLGPSSSAHGARRRHPDQSGEVQRDLDRFFSNIDTVVGQRTADIRSPDRCPAGPP